MVTIILFAPLVGAVLCGFGYKWLSEQGAVAPDRFASLWLMPWTLAQNAE